MAGFAVALCGGKVKSICRWELFLISDSASAEGRGAGNMTEHTPKLAVRSRASLPPRACLLVVTNFHVSFSLPSNTPALTVLCCWLLWWSVKETCAVSSKL